MSYYSLDPSALCGVESIIRARGMISLSELACLRKRVPSSVEEQLNPLLSDGRIECLSPVRKSGKPAPGQIFYRWREASDTRHAWQPALQGGAGSNNKPHSYRLLIET